MWVYVGLNILFGLFFIGFAFIADTNEDKKYIQPIVSMSLTSAVISFLYAACLIFSFIFGEKPTTLAGGFMLICVAFLSRQFMLFCFQFPDREKPRIAGIFSAILCIFALYILLNKFKSVKINYEEGLVIASGPVGFFNLFWKDIFVLLYIVGQPLIGVLNMILRVDSIKNKFVHQQIFLIICSTAAFGLIFYMIYYASVSVPHGRIYNTLLPFSLCVFLFFLYRSVSVSVLFDIKTMIMSVFRFFYTYVIQCVLAGLLFAGLQPLRGYSLFLFHIVYAGGICAIMALSYYLLKLAKSYRSSYDTYEYAKMLESDLSSIDYDESTDIITERLSDIFQRNVDTSSVAILIESNEKVLKTVYSTNDMHMDIPLDNVMFDTILNADHPVVFKSHIGTHHVLSGIKTELTRTFEKSGADAMIVLREGRHVFGVILLGPKKLGNIYTDYDLNVFLKLYSYFFVIGYYMKNIANEAVVGTINRELQFSGQIIQSIQKNIDQIACLSVDVGYQVRSAHTLGGEFLDFIRLSANRYMFIIGDMSGKGINASMSSIIMKSMVRTFLGETADFKELVQKINAFIRFNLPKGTFWAGLFSILDFSDNSMYYINCGIPGLFMYNHSYNNVVEIQGEGRVLGFVEDIGKLLKVKKVKLSDGDILVACTDGIINSKSLRGEMFGKGRVQNSILENQGYPAERMVQFLIDGLFEFTSKEQEDDITVVAVKYLPKQDTQDTAI